MAALLGELEAAKSQRLRDQEQQAARRLERQAQQYEQQMQEMEIRNAELGRQLHNL